MRQPPTSVLAPDFRALFESAPGSYLVLTPDLLIVAVSDAYLHATMTKREQILGRGLFEVFPDNPDDPAASGVRNLRASLDRVRQNRAADAMAVQKYDIRRPESEGGGFAERFWSPVNSPVFGPGGDLAYIIHRVEDVTDFVRLKQLGSEREKITEELRTRAEKMEVEVYLRAQEVAEANRQLQKANAELGRLYEKTKELDRIKTQFFANVSHELRTPLALIIGPAEKLLASAKIDEHARHDLDVVMRNARLLLKHVNDLLDISKLEAGKMALGYVYTDVAQLVRLTAAHFDSLAQEKNIEYRIDASEALRGQIDPEKFQRVILNLLSNAFKFTPARGRIRCTLREDEVRSRVLLEVADSGPGMLPEHREIVFERFRQIDGGSTRRHGGTGLGLAIARDFVELHGGTISVAEAPEGGALLTVIVPTLAPKGTEALAVPAEMAAATDAARHAATEFRTRIETPPAALVDRGGALVLIIEDNPEMNQFVRDSLASEHRTECALDGKEGLRKALELRPDLILSDVMMPEMSGDALVREIRSRPELQSTPIVLLSAKADDELRVRLLREGAHDYVMKPFSVEELRARVRNLVNMKLADEQNRRLNAELQERHERLQQLTSQLETANKELEAFSYSVSHDLRAPLRGIDGFSQALLEDYAGRLDAQGQDYLRRVRAAAQRMAQLIDDLLNLARVTRSGLQLGHVDVTALANEVAAELRSHDPARQVTLRIAEHMAALGDSRLIRLLLENLLGNAWKFTRRRPAATIELGVVQNGGVPEFFVRDDGEGFDMAYAAKLFSPFQRLHALSEFEGTGIGLATVQRIVHRHGGRIWAEGKVGAGAIFRFTLSPAEAPEPCPGGGRGGAR